MLMDDDVPCRQPADLPLVTLDNNALVAVRKNEPDADAVRELLSMNRAGQIVINITVSTALENQRPGETLGWTDHIAWLETLGIARESIFTSWRTVAFSTPDAPHVMTFGVEYELALIERVHAILFPNIPFMWRDYLEREAGRNGVAWQAMEEYDAAEAGFYIPPTPQSPPRRPTPAYDALGAEGQARVRSVRAECQRVWRNAKNDALGFHSHLTLAWHTSHQEWAVFVSSDGNFHKQTKLAKLSALGYRGRILRPRDAVVFLSDFVSR